MTDKSSNKFVCASSVEEAVSILAANGLKAIPVAGATWVMRAPIRREEADLIFVSLAKIDALKRIGSSEDEICIGALVTHDAIAQLDANGPDLNGLKQAALKSANPAIRNAATIGGNICTRQNPSADLVPALLCLDVQIEVQSKSGKSRLPFAEFLQSRATRDSDEIVTHVIVPRSERFSAHARLLMRQAGDYPVVNVSCSVEINNDGILKNPRVAVGSVETIAKRWTALEEAISGRYFADPGILESASSLIGDFQGRDGPDAPGTYRLKVMPKVAAQALGSIQTQYSEAQICS